VTALLAAALLASAHGPAPASGNAWLRPSSALSPADLAVARVAWKYFERNYHPATGLVSSVDGYPGTSLWDLGSSLFATIAARELGLVEPAAFHERVPAMLRTLATLPLFAGELPNKAYDARTGRMTDYENRPSPRGIGFSAVDLGRLVSALDVLAGLHPRYRGEVARVLRHWNYCRIFGGGQMHGALLGASGAITFVQEGRLGYEQYAAHALAPLGDLSQARRYDRFSEEAVILDVPIRHDSRDPRDFGAIDAVVTEPWVLDAFEFGLGAASAPLARNIFEVQKARWRATGIVTAASEDHVDRPPWFVYGSVWAEGGAWRTITASGEDASPLRGLSTKAAFALATLYPDDPYARVLLGAIASAYDPERGWFAGSYENGGLNRSVNANTNGVLLEAVLWKLLGPLHAAAEEARRSGGGRAAAEDADDGSEVGDAESGLPAAACPTLVAPTHVAPAAVPATSAARAVAPPEPRAAAPAPPPERSPAPAAAELYPGLRLGGTAFAGYRGIDGPTVGAVATLWPWRYSFLRVGGEATPMSRGDHGPSRLLWGIGYDDWHGNTLFLHVDNWGPIRPADGLAVHAAELNVGYRLPWLCVSSSVCAAPLAAITAPFAGGPYVSARIQLTFGRDWFVMGGLGWTIPGVLEGPLGTPGWRVVYGFGRSSWAPGTLFVTYYDWGPSYHERNGVLSVGVNWGF
jgi:hypothetical protein